MANGNSNILTAEQEMKLRQPIDEYVGKIQSKIDGLREDGTDKVVSMQSRIDNTKRDRNLTKEEKDRAIAGYQRELETAKAVEARNKDQISKLIADAENYLKGHYDTEYYQKVKASCELEKTAVYLEHYYRGREGDA